MPQRQEERLLRALENPFQDSGGEALDPSLPRDLLERHVDAPDRLEALVLAALHARALLGASFEVLLREPVLSSRLERRLPRSRAAYARVCVASARCVQRLRAMRGTSAAMQGVRRATWAACFGRSLRHGLALERVVRDHDVLIMGETGTGKELVARAIGLGTAGDAQGGPAAFAEINASAVPDTLVESELFGHVKGAFTGATHGRPGLVRSADGGCLFLDEVGDLPLHAQVKLLRVIETDQVQPLGEGRIHQVDVRFIAATHHELSGRVADGRFRADLYQRIAGVIIRLPPLRERAEDVAEIGAHFIEEALHDTTFERTRLLAWVRGPEARAQAWPGNVRELQNSLRNLLLGLDSQVPLLDTPRRTGDELPARIARGDAPLAEVELWYARRALARSDGNVTSAARLLGIDRTTLARKLRD